MLELACDWAYRGRGSGGVGGGGVGAFCRGTALPAPSAAAMTAVEGRGCLLLVRGGVSSSSEEESTLRSAGRVEVVDAAAAAVITIGEKLPGALPCGGPVVCDMAAGL